MARQCHLNTCPAGIATQRDDLRARFKGTPEDVVRFFTAVAEEVRELLAMLGARSLRDIVGQSNLLEQRTAQDYKAATVRLDCLLTRAAGPEESRCSVARNEPPLTGGSLDHVILTSLRKFDTSSLSPGDLSVSHEHPEGNGCTAPHPPFGHLLPQGEVSQDAVPLPPGEGGAKRRVRGRDLSRGSLAITNADRTVGGRIAGYLAVHPAAAFCTEGMTLELDGETNDGAGKSMSGGTIIIRRGRGSDVLAGNAVLYGATGGRLFLAGRAGERFGVRNSGAHAVVEGTGDHACEYMTAGVVAILGGTGVNVGAGMTGGTLFIADAHDRLRHCIHGPSVGLVTLSPDDESLLRELLAAHHFATRSRRAASLLARWETSRHLFRRVLPARELAATTQSPIRVQRTSR